MQSKNHVRLIQRVKTALDILSRTITQPICYSEAAFHLGLPACRKNRYCSGIIIRALNLMCKEDRLQNRPLRASLFVSKNHGIPGKGFWESEDVGLDWVAEVDKRNEHEALLTELLKWRDELPVQGAGQTECPKQDGMGVKRRDFG